MDIDSIGNEQRPVDNKTIFANPGQANNSNSFKVRIGQMQKGNCQQTGYIAKSKKDSIRRSTTSIFHNNSRARVQPAQTLEHQSQASSQNGDHESRFGGANSKSMNRLTSARIYVDQQNETRSDRFNENDGQSLKSGKQALSQTNLASFKNGSRADA